MSTILNYELYQRLSNATFNRFVRTQEMKLTLDPNSKIVVQVIDESAIKFYYKSLIGCSSKSMIPVVAGSARQLAKSTIQEMAKIIETKANVSLNLDEDLSFELTEEFLPSVTSKYKFYYCWSIIAEVKDKQKEK